MNEETQSDKKNRSEIAAADASRADAETAARLKSLRIKAGLDPEGLADKIGISVAWYEDLESQPGELEAGLVMTQLWMLANQLQVGMAFLVEGRAIPEDVAETPFLEVARLIRLRLEHSKDVHSLEEKTGWDLAGFLKHPDAEGWDMRLPFFRDVCKELGIDYRGVLRYCESLREEAE